MVAVEVATGGTEPEVRKGRDLDTVLRQVLFDLRSARDLSWNVAAERWGIPISTLTDFLRGNSMRLSTLSALCAGMKHSPVELFRYHPEYRPENKDAATFAEDSVFNAFRSALDVRRARRLLRIVDTLADRGTLDGHLADLERLLGIPAAPDPDPQERGTTHRIDEARRRSKK